MYNFYMRKIAERLKFLRAEQNLTYENLSSQIGITVSTLFNWENGLVDIPSDKLIILSKFYKVSSDYLLGLED